MHSNTRAKLGKMLDERHRYMRQNIKKGTPVPRPGQTGLCLSVYEPSKVNVAGEPTRDGIYWSGLPVAFAQLVIASIPIVTTKDWSIFMITVSGTALALVTGSLPRWKAEKWPCRRGSYSTYILTGGNGAQHAIIILGNGRGLNLEDLAVSGQMKQSALDIVTRPCLLIVSALWICLLVSAAGLYRNTWYLLAVGGIGILQNVIVAGWRRHPSTLGIHLVFCEAVGEMTTMDALLAVEKKYPGVGKNLLPVFFPGALLPAEVQQWEALAARAPQSSAFVQSVSQPQAVQESWVAHAKTFERR